MTVWAGVVPCGGGGGAHGFCHDCVGWSGAPGIDADLDDNSRPAGKTEDGITEGSTTQLMNSCA